MESEFSVSEQNPSGSYTFRRVEQNPSGSGSYTLSRVELNPPLFPQCRIVMKNKYRKYYMIIIITLFMKNFYERGNV